MLYHGDLTKGHYCFLKNSACPSTDWWDLCRQTSENRRGKLLIRRNDGRIRNGTEREVVTIALNHNYQNSLFTEHLPIFHITVSEQTNKQNVPFCLLSVYTGMCQMFWDSKPLFSSNLGDVSLCSVVNPPFGQVGNTVLLWKACQGQTHQDLNSQGAGREPHQHQGTRWRQNEGTMP